jgi:hypothetical protein
LLVAPLSHLLGEGRIDEFGWPGGGEDDDIAVGVSRGQVAGIPWRVGRAVDLAASMRPGALSKRVDLVVDGSEAERASAARYGWLSGWPREQILELPPPQVDQHRVTMRPWDGEQVDEA